MAREIYVPQAGRSIAFKDDAVDADILDYIRQKYPSATAQPAAAAPPPDEGGVFSLKDSIKNFDKYITSNFITGITDLPGGISAAITDKETLATKFSDASNDHGNERLGIDPNRELTPSDKAAAILGSLGSFVAGGAGAATAVAKGVAAAPKLAKLLTKANGTYNVAGQVATKGVPFIQGGAVTANARRETIEQQRAEGMQITPEQQLWAQRFDFAVGTLEGLPVGRFAKPISDILSKVPATKKAMVEKIIQNRLSRIAGGATKEGAQEAVSGILSDLVEQNVYNPNVAVGDDLWSDVAGGGFAGGLMEGLIQVMAGKKARGSKQMNEDINAEGAEMAIGVRRGQITEGVEALKAAKASGPVDIRPVKFIDKQTGIELSEFQVTDRVGNKLFTTEDPSIAEDAVNLYREQTKAAVTLRKDAADSFDQPKSVTLDPEKSGVELNPGKTRTKLSIPSTLPDGTNPTALTIDPQQLERDVSTPVVRPDEATAETPSPAPAPPETIAEADAEVDAPAYESPTFETSYAPSTQKGVMGATVDDVSLTERPEAYSRPAPRPVGPPETASDEVAATTLAETPYAPPMATPEAVQVKGTGGPVIDPKAELESQKRRDVIATTLNDSLRSMGMADVGLKLSSYVKNTRDGRDVAVQARGAAMVDKTGGQRKSVIEIAVDIWDPTQTVETHVEKALDTLAHEVVHSMIDSGVLRPAEIAMLKRAAQTTKVAGRDYTYYEKATATYAGAEEFSDAYTDPEMIYEEAIADMFRDWRKNAKSTPQQTNGLFNRMLEVLRRIFRSFKSARSSSLFQKMDSGEIGARDRDFDLNAKKTEADAGATVDADVEQKKFSLTRNPEFNKWFDGSVAVNDDGSPKRFFHGTQKSFTQFAKARSGSVQGRLTTINGDKSTTKKTGPDGPFFFSDNPKFADDYAERELYAGGGGEKVTSGQRVIPVHLSVKNPFDYANPQHRYDVGMKMAESRFLGDGSQNFAERMGNKLAAGDWPDLERPDVQKAIRDLGFDGFYLVENGLRNLAVFKSEQIKSTFNEFAPGAATSKKFSLSPTHSEAPLDPYLEAENDRLFAKPVTKTIADRVFASFFGEDPGGKGRGSGRIALALRANTVNKNEAVLWYERIFNKRGLGAGTKGEAERLEADYSPFAAVELFNRASHIAAALLHMGGIRIAKTDGTMASAYVKVDKNADSIAGVAKILMSGPPDADGKPTSLMNAFKAYAIAKRGKRLMDSGKEVPVSNEYIRRAMGIAKQYPQVIEAYKMYQRYNRGLIFAARDAGVISAEIAEQFTNDMDHYSFYRQFGEEVQAQPSGRKLAGDTKVITYKGSQDGELIGDPLMVMVHNSNFWVHAITKNIASQKAFNMLQQIGEARQLGGNQDPDTDAGEHKEVMHMRVNGVHSRYAVKDFLLAKALGSDDRTNLNAFMKILGWPAMVLRESVTRNPTFLLTNMIRDTMSTWVTRGENTLPVIGTVNGVMQALKGSASYDALMGYGVIGSYEESSKTPEEMGKSLRRQALPKNMLAIRSGPDLVKAGWRILGKASDASDAATRIAVYDSVFKQTGNEAEAAFRALDMMNFSRAGASNVLSLLVKVTPFLNARIQGLDVTYQGLRSAAQVATGNARGARDQQIGKGVLVRGLMLMAIATAGEMLLSDDEDYAEIEEYVKTGNFLIPLSMFGMKGQYLAIPKPFEAGLLFMTIPQHLYRYAVGKENGRELMMHGKEQLMASLGFTPIPQALLPTMEALQNYKYHTGLPLVSAGKSSMAPQLQYNASTSTVARMIGDNLMTYNFTSGRWESTSPIMVDHLINSYGGPMAAYVTGAVGAIMNGMEVGPDKMPTPLTGLPGVRSFYVDATGRNPKSVTQAYETFKIVDEVSRTFNRLKKMGDIEGATEYLRDNADIMSTKKYVGKVVDMLNNIRAMERAIEQDKTLSDAEKLEKMRHLRQLEIQATRGMKQVDKIIGR